MCKFRKEDMKDNITIIAAACLALLVSSSCDKHDSVEPSNFPSDRVIRVSTEVNGNTRGYHGTGTPSSLTEFDLLVDTFVDGKDPWKDSDFDKGYCYANSKFTYDSGSGEWIPSVAASRMLWYNSSTEVRVAAISPCQEEGSYTLSWERGGKMLLNSSSYSSLWSVTFEVQAQQSKDNYGSDLLFYYKKGITPKDLLVGGKIPITFRHLLGNLEIKFLIGTEFNVSGVPTADLISDVVVSGTKRTAWFKCSWPSDDLSLDTTGDVSDIKPYNSSWTPAADVTGNCTSVYECILVPQTVAADQFKISFKVAGKPYSWTLPTDYTFESNIKHYLTLKVGKDAVIPGSFSTTEWSVVEGGTLTTN